MCNGCWACSIKNKGVIPKLSERYRKALGKEPNDLPTIYALFQVLDQEGGKEKEMLAELDKGLKLRPNNLFLLHDKARVAAQIGDRGSERDPRRLPPLAAGVVGQRRERRQEAP